MIRQELQVAALENGTVIDHIPANKLFKVLRILHIEVLNNRIMIGHHLKSNKMGKKSIVKITDKFFTDEEINQLSVVAPNVTLSIIRNFEVAEKKCVETPNELRGVVKCINPQCITNNEPMSTLFCITNKEKGILCCKYCEKEQEMETVLLR